MIISNNLESLSSIQNMVSSYQGMIVDILEKISYIDQIAHKTNLLAINATIETIHASDLLDSFEEIVGKNLLIQARFFSKLLEYDPDFISRDGAKLAEECGIEEFYVTDGQGDIVFKNQKAKKNTGLNMPEISKILDNPNIEVVLPATSSLADNSYYKVVAIGRIDQSGVIQFAVHFNKPKGQLAIKGFGVVADEAKRLSDMSKEIFNEINIEAKRMAEKIDELEKLTINLGNIDESETAVKELDQSITELMRSFKSTLTLLSKQINISRQTGLLGVRASIEAANTINEKQEFDILLNRHMIAEAKLASLLIERMPNITCDDITDLADFCGIGEFWITDINGAVELTNVPGGTAFSFTNEGQTAPFMRILADPSLVVTQPPELRDLDNKVYKFAAVSRRDKPGILQIGNLSRLYGEDTAKGFSEVSKQIKNLAEQSKNITVEIEEMIENMNTKAEKAIYILKK